MQLGRRLQRRLVMSYSQRTALSAFVDNINNLIPIDIFKDASGSRRRISHSPPNLLKSNRAQSTGPAARVASHFFSWRA
jgi:hypothetical protein